MYRNIFKRIIDIAVAAILLVFLSPLIALAAILIYVQMGGPVLFCQRRPGLNQKLFLLYKFRTMLPSVTTSGVTSTEAARITPLGRILRTSSIDELPQLFNVLRGDMSLIGPRPLLEEYLPYYTSEEQRRHSVRPGITGLSQINGRNTVPVRERLAMDVTYADGLSPALDFAILRRTLLVVLRQKGVHLSPADSSPDFVAERRVPPSA